MRTPISHRQKLARTAALATVVFSLSGARSLLAEPDRFVVVEEPDGSFSSDEGAFTGYIHPDGTVSMVDKPALQLHGLGASFDITDIAMRAAGMDPYASAKLRHLDNTRDMRVELGKQHRASLLAASPDLMRGNIEAALASVSDAQARKQVLFELWDECAETGEPALVEAGTAARATILEYIQQEMTGPNAYTLSDLRRLNSRRTSSIAFEPYTAPRGDSRYAATDLTERGADR
jgi:hypothetical protein